MRKPAPYSNTDTAEQNALETLSGLINSHLVKLDIRTRDKYPNVDGTIELVNNEQIPIGKFDVQLRSIRPNAKKYSCSNKLVAYSTKSTLPIILICADSANKKAYWKQIYTSMPENKIDQESFTIHFDDVGDAIDSRGIYIQKWLEIISDYQQLIAQYPTLKRGIGYTQNLDNISIGDRKFFQIMIDSINDLLDHDFICVKEALFSGVWKLGTGIFSADEKGISYQIYKIPYGEPAPLICKLDRKLSILSNPDANAFSEYSSSRDSTSDPQAIGKEFVVKNLKRLVVKCELSVHGRLLASNILVSFIDEYAKCVNLSTEQNSYTIQEVSHALNNHLINICAAIASNITHEEEQIVHLDLDKVEQWLYSHSVKPISPSETKVRFSLSSRRISIKSVFEALRYLTANDIHIVGRVFAKRKYGLTPEKNFIWSGYSRRDEIRSVTKILKASITEYSTFVKGNRISLSNSVYLDTETAIIYEYEPLQVSQFWRPPKLNTYYIKNKDRRLPKLSVRVINKKRDRINTTNFPILRLNDVEYEAFSYSEGSAELLFDSMPVLSMIYDMLRNDLEKQYEVSFISDIL